MTTQLVVPFAKDWVPDLGAWYIVVVALVVVGASNAVNLTDGLDGLAMGPVIVAAIALGVLSYVVGHARLSEYLFILRVKGAGELAVFCGALMGASVGFLWFNSHPAEVFMGDVGSLALGGAIGTLAVLSKSGAAPAVHRRAVRDRGGVGDPPGRLVPADRPADLPDGAAPPPLRAGRMGRIQDRDPLLDPGPAHGIARGDDPQAEMTAVLDDKSIASRGAEFRAALAGRRVTVVGLARSGVAACRLLRACGARVTATDAKPAALLGEAARALAAEGVRLHAGGHPPEAFADAELCVTSPGVPAEHPALADCRRRGVPVIGEVELAYRAMTADVLAVTGTNGKTTTTALLGALAAESGRPVLVGGNIGRPLAAEALTVPADGLVVAEVSSFQLETTDTFRRRCAQPGLEGAPLAVPTAGRWTRPFPR